MTAKQGTIDPAEIAHFAKDANKWWDENGPFKPLHRMNPVRMGYIRDQIIAHFDLPEQAPFPLKGLDILDIGCGGGLICESLARLQANVTGADADEIAIEVAKDHAKISDLKINYVHEHSESLLKEKKRFDVVLALEIIEHVSDVDLFVQNCIDLCKPEGVIIFSTLNRTAKSFALGIVAAEYILQWVPRGTHSWKQFLKPSEMGKLMRQSGATPVDIKGIIYNPLQSEFKISDNDLDVNYFMTVKKS